MLKILTFLFATVPALFSAFFAYFVRKHTTAVAGILAMGALLVIFISCINVILQTVIGLLVIPAWLLNFIGMFIPGDFSVVLAAMVSGKICRAAFAYGVKKTDLVVKAN
ncbi:hypothetical protein SAMN04515620_1118 [Collimonas sp. OK607]|uniref:DUF5455 family protein n=1 Tax=Collimonas sp. OK607 TaxID=1798194 RepID=UPI0008E4FC6B|nr:DUF5455 family protein [Collimonas sp. OK607]SFA98652.1 hypothetical protein SAMN04515620_1118 [Collimonas sp. OK607]